MRAAIQLVAAVSEVHSDCHPHMRRIVAATVLSVAVVSAAASQPPAPAPDVQAIGPQVGARAPAFTLPDQLKRNTDYSLMVVAKGFKTVGIDGFKIDDTQHDPLVLDVTLSK